MRKVKSIIPILVLCLAVVLFCAVSASIFLSSRQTDKNAQNIKQSEYAYLVKAEEDGQVMVYEYDSGKYLYALDVDINMLPESDAQKLQKGIPVKDRTALKRLTEDLTG